MGQYYKPLVTNENKTEVEQFMESWDYENGSKLMEHSWLGNSLMNAVERMLIPEGLWYKKRIVWAGDYADKINDISDSNLYDLCEEYKKTTQTSVKIPKKFKYIVNHDKKIFVNKEYIPVTDYYTIDKNGQMDIIDYIIHPLSLLTADGNGQGGGDFFGDDTLNLVGSWKGDSISIESARPKGYTEIAFPLVEIEKNTPEILKIYVLAGKRNLTLYKNYVRSYNKKAKNKAIEKYNNSVSV